MFKCGFERKQKVQEFRLKSTFGVQCRTQVFLYIICNSHIVITAGVKIAARQQQPSDTAIYFNFPYYCILHCLFVNFTYFNGADYVLRMCVCLSRVWLYVCVCPLDIHSSKSGQSAWYAYAYWKTATFPYILALNIFMCNNKSMREGESECSTRPETEGEKLNTKIL